jgi:hypothetical protein
MPTGSHEARRDPADSHDAHGILLSGMAVLGNHQCDLSDYLMCANGYLVPVEPNQARRPARLSIKLPEPVWNEYKSIPCSRLNCEDLPL